MEAALNLCWAVIVVTTFCFWATRRRSAPLSRFTACAQVTALVCMLILLFFPISLTDDLHPEIFVMTDSFAQRRHLTILSAVKTHDATASVGSIPPFLHAIATRVLLSSLRSYGFIDTEVPPSEWWFVCSVANRPPPVIPCLI